MKVADLIPGSIYVSDEKTVTKDFEHTILGTKNGILVVRERNIWRTYRINSQSDQKIYMYLGFTRDAWSINDIYKHHWFLVSGEKIIVNNYSLRLLRELPDASSI
ncbi:MAG TPA: hypothetical protein EYQ69_03605 [Gemmatimonadetes bacterium]|nr:hypothetical protein [Gemmatimonadota bacterium]